MNLELSKSSDLNLAPARWWHFRSHFKELRQTWREHGFKAVLKRYGWKIVAVFFTYYLIRDTILYILIPYIFIKYI